MFEPVVHLVYSPTLLRRLAALV